MTRESKRKWIAVKRRNQAFNQFTNKTIKELKQKIVQQNLKIENLEEKLQQFKSTLIKQRKQTTTLKEYKKVVAKKSMRWPSSLPVASGEIAFSVPTVSETREQVFTRKRDFYTDQFIEQATLYYSLKDDEQNKLRMALNNLSDETLKQFIKKNKLRKVFYESNEEIINGEAFNSFSFYGMLDELQEMGS